jgi:hypothetical protein
MKEEKDMYIMCKIERLLNVIDRWNEISHHHDFPRVQNCLINLQLQFTGAVIRFLQVLIAHTIMFMQAGTL